MKKYILLFLLIQCSLFSQKAKNEGWYIEQLHYPEIKLAANINTFTVEFIPYKDNFKLYMYKDKYDTNFKNAKFPSYDNDLFVLPNFNKIDNGALLIEITDLGMQHNINVEEKIIFVGSTSTKSYIGTVTLSNAINVKVTDRNNSVVVFENTYEKSQVFQTIDKIGNQPILSKDAALVSTKDAYRNTQKQYEAHNLNFMTDALRDIATSLKSKFSFYQERQRINLFSIKNEKKFGLEVVNTQIDKMLEFNKVDYSETYTNDLNQLANESLLLFETELANITDIKDKNQSKIYWSLLSNISGVYYALGNYDKAIEYAEKRKEIDYNDQWKFNLQIAQDRKKALENYNVQ